MQAITGHAMIALRAEYWIIACGQTHLLLIFHVANTIIGKLGVLHNHMDGPSLPHEEAAFINLFCAEVMVQLLSCTAMGVF